MAHDAPRALDVPSSRTTTTRGPILEEKRSVERQQESAHERAQAEELRQLKALVTSESARSQALWCTRTQLHVADCMSFGEPQTQIPIWYVLHASWYMNRPRLISCRGVAGLLVLVVLLSSFEHLWVSLRNNQVMHSEHEMPSC